MIPDTPSTQSFARVRRVFEEALTLPRAEREMFVARACGSDEPLRREVADLLVAADESQDFLAPFEPVEMLHEMPAALGEPVQGARVGGFRLIGRIAEGGMGTVWEAEQLEPRRRVALKTVRLGLDRRESLRRFRHEAEILARLRHPNIARIYASGVETSGVEGADNGRAGLPWYAMEYVEGARTIVEHARGLDLAARLRLFVVLCRAVQHGHEHGVIHRDLKPGNVLVDAGGELKVIDFGVARATAAPGELRTLETETGRVLGTLQYMSPEQVAGGSDGVDTRSDVYALGVLLYELVTGELPYDVSRSSLAEAARTLQESPIKRPGTRVRGLAVDLDAIVLKALEKDRARRYDSSAALADDIERFLSSQPVTAQPPSMAYQLRMFARRHRALVGALAVVLVVLTAATIVSLLFALRAGRAETRAHGSEVAALKDRDEARFREYGAHIAAAQEALRSRNVDGARAHLDLCPPEMRGFEWRHLHGRLDRSILTRPVDGDRISSLVWRRDGSVLWLATRDGRIEMRDGCTGALVRALPVNGAGVIRLVLAPAGDVLAAGGDDGQVRLIGAADLVPLRAWCAHDKALESLVFDPAGSRIMTSGRDERLRVWDTATLRLLREIPAPERFTNLAVAPDGRSIATGSSVGDVSLWEAATGELLWSHRAHGDFVSQLMFAPDGASFASASYDQTARVWDTLSGNERVTLRGHTGILISLDYRPDGKQIATCGWDRTIRLWNAQSGEQESVLLGHQSDVYEVAWSPDGERLASGDSSSHLKLWTRDIDDLHTWPASYGALSARSLAFSRSAGWMITLSGGTARRQAVPDGRVLNQYAAFDGTCSSAALSSDDKLVALGGKSGRVEILRCADGKRVARATLDAGTITRMDWTPELRRIAIGTEGGVLAVVDAKTGKVLARRTGFAAIRALRHSLDGSRLALADTNGRFLVCTADTQTDRCDVQLGLIARDMAWSPDGNELALALSDGRVRIVDPASGHVLREMSGHGAAVLALAWHPGGERLATGSVDRSLRLWDPRSAREVASFSEHPHGIGALVFSSDGAWLASSSEDRTIKLWDAPSDSGSTKEAGTGSRTREAWLEQACEAWLLAKQSSASQKDFERACELARATLAVMPDAEIAWRALGAAQVRLGDGASGIEALEKSLALAPRSLTVRSLRALALLRLDRRAEAGAELRELRLIQKQQPGLVDLTLRDVVQEIGSALGGS